MLIGVPKEIKVEEHRVGLTPFSVAECVAQGQQVLIETQAGVGSGFLDEDYIKAGAKIASSAEEVFVKADMIVKVKEPQPIECQRLREGQILFTYLHLAPDLTQAKGLINSGCSAIAYETVTACDGSLPLLTPMSEVAGRLSIQCAAASLQKSHQGEGILLGGVPGVPPAKVLIIGGGVVGTNAALISVGLGAETTIMDRSLPRLRELNMQFNYPVQTVFATQVQLDALLPQVDVVVGAVLLPGAAAPKLITKDMLSSMRPGSVLVDVSIDQGGCFETSRPTTHQEPTFVEEGIVHYCVANMPGAVPRTSTLALNNATLPYVLKLAKEGLTALEADPGFMAGLNVHRGHITSQPVAKALGMQSREYASIH